MRRNSKGIIKIKKSNPRIEMRGTQANTTKSNTLFSYLSEINPNAKICIFRRLGGIGDVLMVTPTLRNIKRLFPNCELTFAIDMNSTKQNVYYELVKNAHFIDKIANHKLIDKSKYNYTVDLTSVCIRYENSNMPIMNRIDIFNRSCGLPKMTNPMPFYKVEPEERNKAKKLFQNKTKNIVLHTASFEDKRCLPINKYIEVIKLCNEQNLPYTFYIFDFNHKNTAWKEYENCVDCSHTNVREMAAIIEQCDLFIGPDSGPMHIAGALGKNSIVFFGSIPPQARINYYINHIPLTSKVACLGCWYKPCPYNVKCMKEIDSKTIFQLIKTRLK